MDKELCKKFLENPSINPKTGRPIKKDGKVFRQLKEECEEEFPGLVYPHISSPNSISRLPSTKAPPMGPVLSTREGMGRKDDWDKEWEQAKILGKYIMERIPEMEKNNLNSKMEVIDLLSMAQYLSKNYDEPVIKELKKQIPRLRKLSKSKQLINDLPKQGHISGNIISEDRNVIRGELTGIYRTVLSFINDMNYIIQHPSERLAYDIKQNNINHCLEWEAYVKYVVDNNIFSKEDMHRAFQGRDIFKELKESFEKYNKIVQQQQKVKSKSNTKSKSK